MRFRHVLQRVSDGRTEGPLHGQASSLGRTEGRLHGQASSPGRTEAPLHGQACLLRHQNIDPISGCSQLEEFNLVELMEFLAYV